ISLTLPIFIKGVKTVKQHVKINFKKTRTVIVLSLLHICFIFNHNFIHNPVELFASWCSEIVCDGFQQFETKTASAHHVLLKEELKVVARASNGSIGTIIHHLHCIYSFLCFLLTSDQRPVFNIFLEERGIYSCNALKKKPEKGLMKESRVLMLISCVTVHLIDRRSNSCCPNVSCERATMRRFDSTDRTTSGKRQIPQMTTKRREGFLLLFPKQKWQIDLLFLVHHIGLEGFFHRHQLSME